MGIDNLQTLLFPWKIFFPRIFIKDIKVDSRCVLSGDLFIAFSGHYKDGRAYIVDAINRGAVAVIAEFDNKKGDICNGYVDYIGNVPVIYFKNIKKYLSFLSGKFYGYPSYKLNLVGVTGTNGKTTVTHLLFQWLHLLSEKTAVMGTVGNGMFNDLFPSINTTVSSVEIQKMLAYFYQRGVTFVAMEVSSHALVQNRVRDLYFRVAVFTNLTHDHLDYHGSMLAYETAKWKLFSELKVKECVVNGDDHVGFRWLLKLFHGTAVIWNRRLPHGWKGRWLRAVSVSNRLFGIDIFFDSSWGKGFIRSQLIGRYNVINLLLALSTLLTLNYSLSDLLRSAPQLRSVCGRMEVFRVLGSPTVVVDYAHTPDALKRVLIEIRLHCIGKIWCVFGCGGDRDKLKRPVMGEIAEKYSDNVIITDDNPRTEQSQDIINEIKFGLNSRESENIMVIPKREEALNIAIAQANQNDWILIAGKGHENFQIIGNKKFLYSDQDVVKKLLDIKE